MEHRRIEISRLDFQPGFYCRYLFHHGQHRVLQTFTKSIKHALACAADRVIAEVVPRRRTWSAGTVPVARIWEGTEASPL